MAATQRHNEELKRQATKALLATKDPIERLRAACLSRGAQGIQGLSRLFKIMDDDRNKKLCFEEFKKGVNEYGLNFTRDEILEIFEAFDTNKDGSIEFEEFLLKLRPNMTRSRIDLVNKAFNKLDKNHDGVITTADLKGVYIVNKHPKYLNGEWSEDQIFRNFLKTFDTKDEVYKTPDQIEVS